MWTTDEARLRGVLATTGVRLVAHFAQTRRALQALARDEGRTVEVALAQDLVSPSSPDPALRIVVAERHPLREHDERVAAWADSAAGRIVFHVSLDDPVLALFVGESLRPILDKLGLREDAPLQSPLLSRSVASAQAQVRNRASGDVPSDSAAGWLQANGVGALG